MSSCGGIPDPPPRCATPRRSTEIDARRGEPRLRSTSAQLLDLQNDLASRKKKGGRSWVLTHQWYRIAPHRGSAHLAAPFAAAERSEAAPFGVPLGTRKRPRSAAERPCGREHAEPPSGFEGRTAVFDAVQMGRGAMPSLCPKRLPAPLPHPPPLSGDV